MAQPLQINDRSPSYTNVGSETTRRADTTSSAKANDGAYLAPARVHALQHKNSNISETGSHSDSLLDLYGNHAHISGADNQTGKAYTNGDAYDSAEDPESSRWIHRDKLAKIESEELQQAGIILPRTRARSKSSRRDASREQQGNGKRSEQTQQRQRIDASPNEAEEAVEDKESWELRTPEEAAEDQGDPYEKLNGKQGISRIPVCKTSPSPIALTHLERDTPIRRRMSSGIPGEEEGLPYSKIRGRSHSIKPLQETTANSTPTPTPAPVSAKKSVPESPVKKTAGRVTSTSANRSASSTQRPKTRSGRDVSGARPHTRSGEVGAVSALRPEGDPPWLASMYKPDPMLPPDQQLLPTVAKRLQQEQWEREGKFGTAYDTQFRPLNDEQLKPPSEPTVLPKMEVPEQKVEENDQEKDAQWPLRPLPPRSPAPSIGSGGRPGTAGGQTYSVMPKIHTGIPQGVGPLPSSRPPIRVQDAPEERKKGGCGCCVVM